MTREFTINGERFRLDSTRVARALSDELPEPIHEHFAVVGGRRYPPKQVVAVVTGLDRADFTTHQARRILRRLGFPVDRRTRSPNGAGGGSRGSTSAEPGEGNLAGALRPFVGQWVAIRGEDVLVAADAAREVVAWLTRHGQTADSIFRVPEDEAAAGGAAPV